MTPQFFWQIDLDRLKKKLEKSTHCDFGEIVKELFNLNF